MIFVFQTFSYNFRMLKNQGFYGYNKNVCFVYFQNKTEKM